MLAGFSPDERASLPTFRLRGVRAIIPAARSTKGRFAGRRAPHRPLSVPTGATSWPCVLRRRRRVARARHPDAHGNVVDDGILAGDPRRCRHERRPDAGLRSSLALGFLRAFRPGPPWVGACLREAEYAHVQDYSFANLDDFESSSLVTRLTTDVTVIQNALVSHPPARARPRDLGHGPDLCGSHVRRARGGLLRGDASPRRGDVFSSCGAWARSTACSRVRWTSSTTPCRRTWPPSA